MNGFLGLSERVRALPVVHGSADMAAVVRAELLARPCGCLAVPLPESWRDAVFAALDRLPVVHAVAQGAGDAEECSYVPIDPCQPVIAALRIARQERIPTAFVDLETNRFRPRAVPLPDPYALRDLPLEKFLAAALPTLPRPRPESQSDRRARRMAFELHRLELDHADVLFLPAVQDWPWIREAYAERRPYPEHEVSYKPHEVHPVEPRTLAFFLGELPFIAAEHELARAQARPDERLALDGVKRLLVAARDRWAAARRERGDAADWLGPKLLQALLQYIRNWTLLHRRLAPDLYTLVVAAKQTAGDGFARSVLNAARDYHVPGSAPDAPAAALLRMGIGHAAVPGHGLVRMQTRLPGVPVQWASCELLPEPPEREKRQWRTQWNPHRQCSHPPEDERIESFQLHVREAAQALIGQDLVRTEKFTSSIKDGLDMRETLRHWHAGELYVKELPPTRGGLDTVVFLFDVPADPEKYPWRATWMAEHQNESTLALFATDFAQDLVGPGIGRAKYGGAFFLHPPRDLPDIWTDPRLPRTGTLEERLLAGALLHSEEKHVAVASPTPLKAAWKELARRRGKRLVHVPLARFSPRLLDRLRTVHVLNGREVRSYAARYIAGD